MVSLTGLLGRAWPATLLLLVLASFSVTGGCSAGKAVTGASAGATPSTTPISHARLVPGVPVAADLDGDGYLEQVLVDAADSSLRIADGAISYHSRARWKVVQAMLGDTDRNGLTEVVALLDSAHGRHLGLFAYFGGQYRERLVTKAIAPIPMSLSVLAQREGAGERGDEILMVQRLPGDWLRVRRSVLRWNSFSFTLIATVAGP